jgi:biotin transport system substrate-specific component
VLKSVPAMIVGEVIIYAFGLTWLALDLHLGAAATLTAGFTPFVAGDAIKAAIAAGLLPVAWRLAGRRQQDEAGLIQSSSADLAASPDAAAMPPES